MNSRSPLSKSPQSTHHRHNVGTSPRLPTLGCSQDMTSVPEHTIAMPKLNKKLFHEQSVLGEHIGNPATKANSKTKESPLQRTSPQYYRQSILEQSHRRISQALGMSHKENQPQNQALEQLGNQHRLQIEHLLLEISRLHDLVSLVEKQKRSELAKAKQMYEHMTYMQISSLRGAQQEQQAAAEAQLRHYAQMVEQTQALMAEMERDWARERDGYRVEIEGLKGVVREVVERKNTEVFMTREESEAKLKEIYEARDKQIESMREECERQLGSLKKALSEKQYQLGRISQEGQQHKQDHTQLQKQIEQEREQLQQRLTQHIHESSQKYHSLLQHCQQLMQANQDSQSQRQRVLRGGYEQELANLLLVIKCKDTEINSLRLQIETRAVEFRLLSDNLHNENKQLKKRLQQIQRGHLQELELLKVKMGVLHENDISQLVQLNKEQMRGMSTEMDRQAEETRRLRDLVKTENHRYYQQKKQYEDRISELNIEIIGLRNRAVEIEQEMRDKAYSDRSDMLLTSQQLIKDNQIKEGSNRFYEDELRKLRALIVKGDRNRDEVEAALRQEITDMQQQIRSLADMNRANTEESAKIQEQYEQALQQKSSQIRRLNALAHQLLQQSQAKPDPQQLNSLKADLSHLQAQLAQCTLRNTQLQLVVDSLNPKLKQLEAKNEHLQLQHQLIDHRGQQQHQEQAENQIRGLREVYQRRIVELERDKQELRAREDISHANVRELVRKYRAMEEAMARLLTQGQRRGELEKRILELGLDGNLVANKLRLFGSD